MNSFQNPNPIVWGRIRSWSFSVFGEVLLHYDTELNLKSIFCKLKCRAQKVHPAFVLFIILRASLDPE